MPDFGSLCAVVRQVYASGRTRTANAQYIPQLAQVDPEQFSISVTTVDGQHFSIGDADTQFCIQSCSKPLSYLLALNEFGEDYVHSSVGTEPAGGPSMKCRSSLFPSRTTKNMRYRTIP